MCANFWDPRSHDRESKNAIFGLKIYSFAYNSNTTSCALLKFVHNVGNYIWFMQTKFGCTQSRDQNATSQKWAES